MIQVLSNKKKGDKKEFLEFRECIERGVLEEFLRRNRAEVLKMSIPYRAAPAPKEHALRYARMGIYEYDEEKHMQQERRDAREEGIQLGIQQGAQQTLELINHLDCLLAQKSRTDDIVKASMDREYQKKLLKEFGLIK